MYYIMSESDGKILETSMSVPTQEELQEIANYMDCDVYVIQGEHFGMTAAPRYDDEGDRPGCDDNYYLAEVNM